jgi:hypothetical protein
VGSRNFSELKKLVDPEFCSVEAGSDNFVIGKWVEKKADSRAQEPIRYRAAVLSGPRKLVEQRKLQNFAGSDAKPIPDAGRPLAIPTDLCIQGIVLREHQMVKSK